MGVEELGFLACMLCIPITSLVDEITYNNIVIENQAHHIVDVTYRPPNYIRSACNSELETTSVASGSTIIIKAFAGLLEPEAPISVQRHDTANMQPNNLTAEDGNMILITTDTISILQAHKDT